MARFGQQRSPRSPSEPETVANRVRRPIGVLVSRFPLITETFILREIEELERQGQPVVLIPMIRENPKVVHDEARRWVDRAVFAPFISWRVLRSFLRAWLRKPGTMFHLTAWMVRKTLLHPRVLVKSLILFPKSVHLAEWVETEEIRHLHAHFATHPATMAYIIASLTGLSFSFTVHAHDIFVDRSLLREKIERASFVRSISKFNQAFLENLFPRASAGKIRVVHVGIEPDRYREGSFTSGDEAVRILCIAAMKPYKGIPFLIQAARILRLEGIEFQLDVVGSGPLMSQVTHAIADHHLGDCVHLLGALPQDRVADLIRRADLFVLPSIVAADGQMEGIPVALMEAMAAGKPVVSTSISGIPELVENEVSGLLVDPANPRQLAEAMRRLIADPALRRRLADQGRRTVEEQFDLRNVVSELIPSFDRFTGALEETGSLPDIGRSVAWGIRRRHVRDDSQVLEVMAASESGVGEIILKRQLSRPGESRPAEIRSRDEVELLRRLAPHFEGASAGRFRLGVPGVIGFDADTSIIAMERAGERTLEDSIRDARGRDLTAEELGSRMEAAGRWLGHFQDLETVDASFALSSEVSAGLNLLGRLGGIEIAREQSERLTVRIATLEARLEGSRRTAVSHHGDFWPGNVFVSRDRLQVIDFEGYRLALPSKDVSWFLLHVGLYLAYRAPRLLELARDSFMEGYGKALDPAELELTRIVSALQVLDRDDTALSFLHRVVRRRYLGGELSR